MYIRPFHEFWRGWLQYALTLLFTFCGCSTVMVARCAYGSLPVAYCPEMWSPRSHLLDVISKGDMSCFSYSSVGQHTHVKGDIPWIYPLHVLIHGQIETWHDLVRILSFRMLTGVISYYSECRNGDLTENWTFKLFLCLEMHFQLAKSRLQCSSPFKAFYQAKIKPLSLQFQ